MTGGEGGKPRCGFEVAGGNVVVKVVEELDEGVGIAFGVSAGIGGVGASFGSEERRILDQFTVGFIAAADPESVGIFAIPGERAFAAVDFEIQSAFPTGAYLRNGEDAVDAVFEMNEDGGIVIGFDGDFIGGDVFGGRERFDVAAWLVADGNDGSEISAEFGDFLSGNPLNKIEPVGADVGDGAKFAAEFGFKAPVPIGGIGKPVLQEAAVDEADFADGARSNKGFGLNAERVVAEVVGDATDAIGLFGERHELRGFARVHGERLFAHNVFTSAEKSRGLREMNVVGRADVDCGDFGVGGDFVDAGVGVFEAESFRGSGAAAAGTDQRALDANRDAAKGFDVGFTDESGSDDGGDLIHV